MPRQQPDERGFGPDDPLAALLGAGGIARPRTAYRERLRAELIARPPLTGDGRPWRAAAGRLLPLVLTVVLIATVVVTWTADHPWPRLEAPGGAGSVPTAARMAAPAGLPTERPAPTDTRAGANVPATASVVPAEQSVPKRPVVAGVPTPVLTASPATIAAPTPGTVTRRSHAPRSPSPTVELGDLPDVTPQPGLTASVVPPASPTPTTDGYPRPPATPTAAPTSIGVPTSRPPEPTATAGAPPPDDRAAGATPGPVVR